MFFIAKILFFLSQDQIQNGGRCKVISHFGDLSLILREKDDRRSFPITMSNVISSATPDTQLPTVPADF